MMACNCLNVLIDSKVKDAEKLTCLSTLNLTKDEMNDCFFKKTVSKSYISSTKY